MKRIIRYVVLILLLLVANLWLLFDSPNIENANQRYFVAEDLENAARLSFTSGDQEVILEKQATGWMVNGTHTADAGFVQTLLNILQQVEVGRTLDIQKEAVIGSVEIATTNNINTYRFDYGSNPTQTRSYFIDGEHAKEVAVPGYRDQVIDLFKLHADQWRDRAIIDGSWRSIQKLKVMNTKGKNFEIQFNETFFTLNDQAPTDSSALITYLDLYRKFLANEMITTGRFPVLDSLAEQTFFANITIEDIKYETSISLDIYPPIPGQKYHLVEKNNGERMVIDSERIQALLAGPPVTNVRESVKSSR